MHRFPAALLAAAALAAGFSPALAKETVPVDRPLPVDDRYDVRETLPSGLKLYVRHHEVPKGMVAMWLHFGTGSVNETDAERGLAHVATGTNADDAVAGFGTGSIHRATWPASAPLRALAGDAAGADGVPSPLAVASDVLGRIRKAKSDAKVSMRTEVAAVTVTASAARGYAS